MIAALFPGQNSQALGMAKDFYEQSEAAHKVLDLAEATLPGLLQLMWEGPEEALKLTANQQPALVAAAAAAFAAYQEANGVLPSYAAGHSLGEFSAHVAAGSLSLEHALKLVRMRGEYMQAAVPQGIGAMAAIMKLNPTEVEHVCRETAGVVEVANFNSPEQTVISGEAEAVARASERLKALKARVIPLKVSAPFHCSLMKPAADKLAAELAKVQFKEPAFKIICNVTADILINPQDAPALLERQVTAPVRWTRSILKLKALGVTHFIEFGSGKVLTGLTERIIEDAKALAVTDMASLQEAL